MRSHGAASPMETCPRKRVSPSPVPRMPSFVLDLEGWNFTNTTSCSAPPLTSSTMCQTVRDQMLYHGVSNAPFANINPCTLLSSFSTESSVMSAPLQGYPQVLFCVQHELHFYTLRPVVWLGMVPAATQSFPGSQLETWITVQRSCPTRLVGESLLNVDPGSLQSPLSLVSFGIQASRPLFIIEMTTGL